MEILISIAAKVCEYTVAPIGRQLGYLFFYRRNVEDLNTQIVDLGHVKDRLQHKVEEAQNNARGIEADVSDWLAKADKVITEDHGNFTRDEEQANTKCVCGSKFLNPVLRHRLSRRAKKMAETVATQIQEGKNINEVSYRLNLPISIGNKGYEDFESRNRTFTDVMEALRHPNVGMVGLWGMGGVGKTMLAKEVARRAMDEEKLFTEVVFTTISKDPNIEKIQQDIGEKLRLRFEGESRDVRADQLQKRLRAQENKILIIVDDIWDKLDLEDIGISFGEDQKGCKILLTTRYSRVLACDMRVDGNVIFEVGVLSEHEAMSLFRKIVGDQADKQELQGLAGEIVKECGGLPIAIATVASALKVEHSGGWKNALQELRKSNPINIDGVQEKVYNSIKLSYDYLKSGEAKHLLLLCSLFPEDALIEIRVLCDYGFGLNLFEDVSTLEEARNKTDTLVTKLKDHSLLLDADSSYRGYVKLHDVIRDVVIFVASKLDDHHRMHNIRNADELEKYFNKEMFKDSTAISLYDIKADQYPQTLKGPELNLLRLVPSYDMEDSWELPHQFFEGLNKLLVFDCFTSLKPLPAASSFCLLPNLQTLRLTGECNLGDISWIGELKSLKILDLSFNDSITELPRGIGKLNRLLSLNLERCSNLKVIEPNVISSLTRLEELNLKRCIPNWEVEGVANADDERRNANLSELKELRRLNDLKLDVKDINSLPKDIFSENLEKYYIRIGSYSYHDWLDFGDEGGDYKKNTSRTLKLELCRNSALNEHEFAALLGRSDILCLRGLKISKSIAFETDRRGFQRLKYLKVEQSTKIRCIVNWNNGNMDCPPAAFPSLESLVLWNLMSLENIIHEKLTTETSFGQLRDIEVSNCDKLKSLFSLFNIPKQLKWIEVEDCEMMEEIISHDGDHVEEIEISKLRSLKLSRLPKLVQFIATSKSDEIKREGRHSIDAPLFNGQVVFPKLDELDISSLNIQKIWNGDQLTSSRFGFQNLTQIKVDRCDHLKGLIPSCMTASFVHLRNLNVSRCMAIKEIVFIEESAQAMGIFVSFPKLESLQLSELPILERFCGGDFSSPQLESLHLIDLPNLERRFGFQNLTQIKVDRCDHLKGLIPSCMTASLVHLRYLNVSCCMTMKEIVFIEESAQAMEICVSFPKLESLQLRDLPVLERFCGGDFSSPQLESLHLIDLPNLERFSGGDCVDCPFLSKLKISDCEKLKVFITNTMATATIENEDKKLTGSVAGEQHLSHHKLVFPKLDKLDISSLYIQKIWIDDQLTSSRFGFQNLTRIKVDRCDHLKGLIPSCMTASLVHLRYLNVSRCMTMKEIVFIEESAQTMEICVSFPKLESLQLRDLPVLERFCGGDFSSPQLESLHLIDLPNLERFSGGDCVDCPFLSKLAISDWKKLKVCIRNTIPTTITENEDKNSTRSVADKQHLSHHKVVVKVDQLSTECSSSEITCQPPPLGSVEEHDEYLVFKTKRLSELTLWNFPNQQQLPKTFSTVKLLSICEWSIRLKDLATPLMSFKNLNNLTVVDCHGLTSLFSPSTAKSLSQRLTQLKIIGCKSLRQVIANDDDDDDINIIFSQLECLVLDDLSNLTSFYSGHNNVVLQFPLLAGLIVGCCPEMKTFSPGNIHCPSLHSIIPLLDECWSQIIRDLVFEFDGRHMPLGYDRYWKGDINTTIQKLWEEKNIRDSPETEESVEKVDNAKEDEAVGP